MKIVTDQEKKQRILDGLLRLEHEDFVDFVADGGPEFLDSVRASLQAGTVLRPADHEWKFVELILEEDGPVTLPRAGLEWHHINLPSDPTFGAEHKIGLFAGAKTLGWIARHKTLFYPVTADGLTSDGLFPAIEEAKTALEDHVRGRKVFQAPLKSLPLDK
jgi:hypothetical protein